MLTQRKTSPLGAGAMENTYSRTRRLGGGAFATVYDHSKTRVMKILRVDDTAYLAYLQQAIKHQENPYFPRVYELTRLSDSWAIKLERLQRFSSTGPQYATLMRDNFRRVPGFTDKFPLKGTSTYKALTADAQEWIDIYNKVMNGKRYGGSTEQIYNDVCMTNCMWRGTELSPQLVMTDPVS